jgi:nitrate reductase (NAD(P)H)
MDVLMASGFITPPSIHYVRNHGAVPKLSWESHTITVNGLVEQQLTISMDELAAMPSVTIPVTLVCAGTAWRLYNCTWVQHLAYDRTWV